MKKITYMPLAGERLAWYRRQEMVATGMKTKVWLARVLQGLVICAGLVVSILTAFWWVLYTQSKMTGGLTIESLALRQAMFWRASCFSLGLLIGGYVGFCAIWRLECFIEDCRRVVPRSISGSIEDHNRLAGQFIALILIGLLGPIALIGAIKIFALVL